MVRISNIQNMVLLQYYSCFTDISQEQLMTIILLKVPRFRKVLAAFFWKYQKQNQEVH